MLYPILVGDKWGFMDRSGRPVVLPRFLRVGPFSEGLAPVFVGQMQSSREVDRLVIGPDGAARAGSETVVVAQWGFLDEAGNMAIEPQFDHVEAFRDGLAAAGLDGRLGYLDKTGNWAIKPGFAYDPWTVGPVHGRYLATELYEDAKSASFYDGRARVKVRDGYAFIDKTGEVRTPSFAAAHRFSEGLAAVALDGYVQYIDPAGKPVFQVRPLPATVSRFGIILFAGEFSEGLADVNLTGRVSDPYGFIDRTGQVVIQPQFSGVEPFHEGLAAARTDGEAPGGYIDPSGRWAIEPRFPPRMLYRSFSEGLAACYTSGGPYGYIDKSGVFLVQVPCKYCMLHPFQDGIALVLTMGSLTSDDHGYIDREGNWVWRSRPAQPPLSSAPTRSASPAPSTGPRNSVTPRQVVQFVRLGFLLLILTFIFLGWLGEKLNPPPLAPAPQVTASVPQPDDPVAAYERFKLALHSSRGHYETIGSYLSSAAASRQAQGDGRDLRGELDFLQSSRLVGQETHGDEATLTVSVPLVGSTTQREWRAQVRMVREQGTWRYDSSQREGRLRL